MALNGEVTMSRRRKRLVTLLVTGTLVLPYLTFSACAGGPLSPADAVRVFRTVVRTAPTLVITPRNYLQAVRARARSLRAPDEEAVVHVRGTAYRVPLPPETAAVPGLEENVKYYVTFATLAERERFSREAIPAAGWTLRERIAGQHFYVRDGVLLGVGQRAFAGRHVIALTISAGEWDP